MHKFTKALAAIGLAAVMSQSAMAENLKLGFLVKQPEEPWFQTEWKFADKAGKDLGFDVIKIAVPDGEKTLNAIDSLAASGAKGFVICTPDPKLGSAIVAKARGYDMKVITVDDQFVNAKGKPMESVPLVMMAASEIGARQGHAEEILPGETATIVLTYHPKNHPGTIDTDAFVYLSCSEKHPVARLTLTGNVLPGADEWARYPYAMGRLRLKQNRMEFQEVMPGKRPSERILCGNSGDKPLRLSALVIPKFATFRTEPEVIQPGSEADIVVTVDASLIPAGKEKTFTFPIIIEGVDARPSDRTLNIKVNYTK